MDEVQLDEYQYISVGVIGWKHICEALAEADESATSTLVGKRLSYS